jgi:hypothetical protein
LLLRTAEGDESRDIHYTANGETDEVEGEQGQRTGGGQCGEDGEVLLRHRGAVEDAKRHCY